MATKEAVKLCECGCCLTAPLRPVQLSDFLAFSFLCKGFEVPESVVTSKYIEAKEEGVEDKDLFKVVCKKLIEETDDAN